MWKLSSWCYSCHKQEAEMDCSWRHEHLCLERQAWRQALRCVVSSTLSSRHGDKHAAETGKVTVCVYLLGPPKSLCRQVLCTAHRLQVRELNPQAKAILQNQPADKRPSWDANPAWKRTPCFDERQQSLVAQSMGFMSADGGLSPCSGPHELCALVPVN